MTVKELIEKLEKVDGDTKVFLDDSEWGDEEMAGFCLYHDRKVGKQIIFSSNPDWAE